MKPENSISAMENSDVNQEMKSKKIVKTLIILYLLISITCMCLFQNKILVTITALIQIGFALFIFAKSKGIITFDYATKSSQPSLFFPLLIPIVALFATGIIDITILDYSMFWFPFGIWLVLYMLVVIWLIIKNKRKQNAASYVTSVILGAAFSFGITINSNQIPIFNSNEQYKTQITDKWAIEGRNTTYHFMLSPCGPYKNITSIKVFLNEYEIFTPGDSITIAYNSGLYNIPYIKLVNQ